MDEQLRALERTYALEPSGDNLLALLQTFARSGQDRIPEGDILALALISQEGEWYRSFQIDIIRNLLDLGYPVGVYFHLAVKMLPSGEHRRSGIIFPSLPAVCKAIHEGLVRKITGHANQIRHRANMGTLGRIDVVDNDYFLAPANSSARETMSDGRPKYQHDAEEVCRQLLDMPSDLYATILRYSSVIQPPTTNKKREITACYRIFIPAEELERSYWTLFIGSQGFRRSATREHGKSMIDWGTKRQFKMVQSSLFFDVNEWVQRLDEATESIRTSCTKLGSNLLLALSSYYGFRQRSWLR